MNKQEYKTVTKTGILGDEYKYSKHDKMFQEYFRTNLNIKNCM